MKNMILFLSLFFAFSLYAKDEKDWVLDLKTSTLIPKYAGVVKEIRGNATIEDRSLEKDSKFYPDEIIKTDDKSFLKLQFIDDTIVTMGPKTEFQVAKWNFRTKNDRDSLLSLLKGRVRVEIKSKSKIEGQLKYKSPLVAMGVRGTTFLLNNTFQKNKEISQIALVEGNIFLNVNDSKEKIEMKPGDYVEIIKGAQNTKKSMRAIDPEKFDQMKLPDTPGEFRLMDEITLNETETQEKKSLEENNSSLPETNPAGTKVKKSESLKEKIKILNTIREENRKK